MHPSESMPRRRTAASSSSSERVRHGGRRGCTRCRDLPQGAAAESGHVHTSSSSAARSSGTGALRGLCPHSSVGAVELGNHAVRSPARPRRPGSRRKLGIADGVAAQSPASTARALLGSEGQEQAGRLVMLHQGQGSMMYAPGRPVTTSLRTSETRSRREDRRAVGLLRGSRRRRSMRPSPGSRAICGREGSGSVRPRFATHRRDTAAEERPYRRRGGRRLRRIASTAAQDRHQSGRASSPLAGRPRRRSRTS